MKNYINRLVLSLLVAMAGTAYGQELIVNGNFSASTANWISACTSVEAYYFETTYGGTVGTNRVAEVDDESCFRQDICVLPGYSYTFSMQASRRTSGGPNPTTSHIKITGLDVTNAVVATYVDMDFTRNNTTFSLTNVTGIPTINVATGSGVVRLRVALTDNTPGFGTLGMIVDNLSLTFVSVPLVTTGTGSACQNSAATLTLSGPTAGATDIFYNWTFSAGATPATSTSATPSVTWSTAGTATATVQVGNGACYVDTVSYTLPVNATSAQTIFDTICFNDPVTFNGSVLNTTGTYLDTLTNIGGCDSFVTLQLFVKPVPAAPDVTGDTFYCQGETFVPFSVTGSGHQWYTVATGGVGSSAAPVVPTGTPGIYTYYVSQVVNGCESARDSIRVEVFATPTAPVAPSVTYCQFEPTVQLTATGTNILWYTVATGGTGNATAPTPNSATAGVTTWYVSQTVNTCESPRTTVTATVNARPPAPVITNTPGNYCPGQPFNNWTVVLGANILWYTSATGGTGTSVAPVVNTSVPGTYTWWASQTVLGCEGDRAQVSVTVYAAVTAGYTYTVKLGCSRDTVSFFNNSIGGVAYQWDFGDGSSSSDFNPVHIYTAQGVYNVKLFTHSFTCVDSNIQAVNLVHKDSAAFNIASPVLCQGQSTLFTNQSDVTITPTWTWHFGDGSSDTARNPTHIYPHTGVYTVTLIATDGVPCSDTVFSIVTVDSSGGINMTLSDTVLCRGTYVTVQAHHVVEGNTGLVWDMGNGDSVVDVNPLVYGYLTTGTHTITATTRFRACPTLQTMRVITVMPQPVINLGPDTAVCPGSLGITLGDILNDASAGIIWHWNTGATTHSITVNTPGVYAVRADLDNCIATDTVQIGDDCYIHIPNIFSPNGDGVNDYFDPRNVLGSGITAFSMDIYNRWGQLIFQTTKTNGRGWDGKYNNEPQPQGVFIYDIKATFSDGQQFSRQGNVTLIR